MSAGRARTSVVRVAFYGRVGHDSEEGATDLSLARQSQQCVNVLPPGAVVAVFRDVGSLLRRRPASPSADPCHRRVRRDGDFQDRFIDADTCSVAQKRRGTARREGRGR